MKPFLVCVGVLLFSVGLAFLPLCSWSRQSRAEERRAAHREGSRTAQWYDDRRVRRALEEANRVMFERAPVWTFERVCQTVQTVCGVLCVAGFAYVIFFGR